MTAVHFKKGTLGDSSSSVLAPASVMPFEIAEVDGSEFAAFDAAIAAAERRQREQRQASAAGVSSSHSPAATWQHEQLRGHHHLPSDGTHRRREDGGNNDDSNGRGGWVQKGPSCLNGVDIDGRNVSAPPRGGHHGTPQESQSRGGPPPTQGGRRALPLQPAHQQQHHQHRPQPGMPLQPVTQHQQHQHQQKTQGRPFLLQALQSVGPECQQRPPHHPQQQQGGPGASASHQHPPNRGPGGVAIHAGCAPPPAVNYQHVRAAPAGPPQPPPPPRHARVELSLEKTGRRIAVNCVTGYDELVNAACKSIPGRDFDGTRRRWTFPETSLGAATAALKSAKGVNIEVMGLLPMVQRALAVCVQLERAAGAAAGGAAAEVDGTEVDGGGRGNGGMTDRPPPTAVEEAYGRVPLDLREALFPFQREGVMYGLARGGRVLIGDQMGLGKTLQALSLIACYQEDWPALILVPTSLRDAWETALRRWLNAKPTQIAAVASGKDGNKLSDKRVMFAVVSYSLVSKLAPRLQEINYQVVVCDESHFLKDGNSQRSKVVVPLLKSARRAVCLTGTPALSRPVELYSQLEALRPNVFTKFNEFAKRYCDGARFGWNGCQNADELYAVISRLVMVRRLKKDVLTQLPPKQREQVFLTVPKSDALNEVKAVLEQLKGIRRDNGGMGTAMSAEEKRLMNLLYVASAKAKVAPVQEYLETLLDGSAEKFLFFAHHAELLDAASAVLRKRKVQFIRIDGSTPTSARGAMVNAFQESEAVRVAVLSIKAAGMGLTLTAASTVVFGELSWTPGDIVQAEDRAHRIGQVSSVNVQFLCARNTVDDIMWGSVQNKLENLGQVLDGTSGDHLELKGGGGGVGGSGGGGGAQEGVTPRHVKAGRGGVGSVASPVVGPSPGSCTPKAQGTLDGFVTTAEKKRGGEHQGERGGENQNGGGENSVHERFEGRRGEGMHYAQNLCVAQGGQERQQQQWQPPPQQQQQQQWQQQQWRHCQDVPERQHQQNHHREQHPERQPWRQQHQHGQRHPGRQDPWRQQHQHGQQPPGQQDPWQPHSSRTPQPGASVPLDNWSADGATHHDAKRTRFG